MNKKLSEKQFYQPGSNKATNCTNNVTSLPSWPATWGDKPRALCTVWGGGDPGSPAEDKQWQSWLHLSCSGSVHVLILKLSPRENTSLFKVFKTTTHLHFSHVFYFDKKKVSLRPKYIGENSVRLWHGLLGPSLRSVSPGTPPTLVCSWDPREKCVGLRTKGSKGSGLRPSSNSALLRLVWAEGRVPRQPGVLPVTQFQD